MDPDHAGSPLPLLRFKGNDKGVERLPPSKLIHDIWPELPPAHRIHFFVTYTGRKSIFFLNQNPSLCYSLCHVMM
jgi:hypothetical protein